MYDILIPAAEKDFVKLRFVYDSIMKSLSGFDKIYCISDVKIPRNLLIPGVQYYLDEDVVDFDFSKFRGRVRILDGFYRYQFVNLFQQVTSDSYLEINADIYLNKKIDIIEDGKPVFLFGNDQNHPPNFHFMEKLLNLGRVHPYSFISEMMFFKREIINHMVSSTGFNKYGFFELAVNILNRMNEDAGMSYYELYGNYVVKHFKHSYKYRHIKIHVAGKGGFELKKILWEEGELQRHIDSFRGTDYDILSFHSWLKH